MRPTWYSRAGLRAFITGYTYPLSAWRIAHRLGAMLLTAALTLSTSVCIQRSKGGVDLRAQRTAIAMLEARVQSATALATPQRTGRTTQAQKSRFNHSAPLDDTTLLEVFAPALNNSDLKLDAFEPSESTSLPGSHERRVQLRVRGSFAALMGFAARLENLSVPIVPVTAQLHAQAHHHLLEVVLRVVGVRAPGHFQWAPHKAVQSLENSLAHWSDPFVFSAEMPMSGTEPNRLRLIGILQRGRTRAALVQSSTGIKLLHAGETFEGATVQRISEAALWLSDGMAMQRTLVLHELSSARPASSP